MADLDQSPIMQLAGEGRAEDLQAELRGRALRSLYYFAKVVMNYNKFVPHVHLDFCLKLQNSISIKKRGFLWPRGHFKSTAMKAYVLWRLCGGGREARPDITDPRNLRFLFVSESSTVAESKLKDVRWHIENNQTFRWLFPEIIPPDFNKVKWTDSEFTINRSESYDEGSVTAIGIGGKTTGFHYDCIIYDDPIGEKASKSEAEMQGAIHWFQFAPGLLNEADLSEELVAGTRWKHGTADLYGWIMDRMPYGLVPKNDEEGAAERHEGFKWYLRSAKEAIDDEGTMKPIFPERFPIEVLDQIKKREGVYKFSCNYMNNPTPPEGGDFPESLIGEYEVVQDATGNWCVLHPTDGTPDVKLSHLYRVSYVDPSPGGQAAECEAAIALAGMSSDRRIFALHVWSKNCGYGAIVHRWHELNDQFLCHQNAYECVSAQKVLGEEIVPNSEMFQVCPYCSKKHRRLKPFADKPPGGKDKEERIRLYAQHHFENKKVYLRANMDKLKTQISCFPFNDLVDQFDAFAGAIHLLRPPKPLEEIEMEKQFEAARKEMASSRTFTEYNYGGYV